MDFTDHYKILLELDECWQVDSIAFNHEQNEVLVRVSYHSRDHLKEGSTIHDYSPLRRWRHLDTLQYLTYIEAKVPRLKDEKGKVSTMKVPWADSLQRHSYLLEKKS